jgi:hypothetical protein
MNRDEVLDEVARLASIEHAMIVECLSVQCALGHNLEANEGGASNPRGREAADGLSSYAQNSLMNRFRDLNLALVAAGHDAQLERAFDPPTVEQLEHLIEHEREIAEAADKRYSDLKTALDTATGLEPDLLDRLRPLIEEGSDHVAAVHRLEERLGDPVPIDILRATRRVADGSFEQNLLDLSDSSYRLVVQVLRNQFVPDVFPDQALAVKVMDGLDAANRVLVQRGLLPPFNQ